MDDRAAAATPGMEETYLVQRILGSQVFRKSHRLSSFLRYIFEQYSRGQLSAINEARIGTEVFGRPPGYHSGDDGIVRSQARFLRQRLEEYFATEGSQEPLVLTIPKGSYVPVFERRTVVASLAVREDAPVGGELPKASVAGHSSWLSALYALRRFRVPLLVAMLLSVTAWAWVYRVPSRPQAQAEPPVLSAFWSSLFNRSRATVIVPADSTLVLMEEMTGKTVHLTSYIDRSYLNSRPAGSVPLWDMLAGSEYTSTADLNLVARLQRFPEAIEAAPEIRDARDLSLKDLKERNAILIGGLRANPWIEMFSSSTNFDVEYDVEQHRNLVRNRAPGANEQPLYIEGARSQGDASAYGVVVYLPSLDNQGHALLVEGTSKAGTEAAAEFLTSPAFARFLQMLAPKGGAVPNFELLLSTGMMDGASYHPVVVCWHMLHKSQND